MARRAFVVSAIWDEEAEVFFSESDIIGLHIEAKTLDEFEAILLEVGPELVVENHLKDNLDHMPLVDLIPSIVLRRPLQPAVA